MIGAFAAADAVFAASYTAVGYAPSAIAAFRAAQVARAAAGLLPAVPSALQKLQNLGISLQQAKAIIDNPTTQELVDNANGGNINYVADIGGKLVRITTDPTGQRIISAGRMRANQVANGIANGRFTK